MAAPITAYSLSNGQEPISYDELGFLEQLCDLLPEEPVVVNIGAADGLSTITILSRRPKALIYSVDCEPCPQELENVRRAGLDVGRVIRMLGRSEELGKHFPFAADFLFVDGGHFNAGNDCAAWLCHVKPGGIVAFHDYMEQPPPNNPGSVYADIQPYIRDLEHIGRAYRLIAVWQDGTR